MNGSNVGYITNGWGNVVKRFTAPILVAAVTMLAACSDGSGGSGSAPLRVGAASASILPTVGDTTDYLKDAPSWGAAAGTTDPNDIGVFIAKFDQGNVSVSNGNSNASWVHDDVRATAVAIERGSNRAIILGLDTYMTFSMDADRIEEDAKTQLPEEWKDAPILIAPTHNHHGPDVAFDINPDYYAHLSAQAVSAVLKAVQSVQPAVARATSGEHRFGVSDGRDPIVFDPRVNVIDFSTTAGSPIATIVQWTSHPESTLGWNPPVPDIARRCAEKGWTGDDCSADGRYFTADYPGVLRSRLQQAGKAEVLYMNGPLGSQIGPGDADVWKVDDAHPVGFGWVVPDGASPVAGCSDFRCRNLARTEAIGSQLAKTVLALLEAAPEVAIDKLEWKEQPFYTRLTNIGFRLLIADGDLGWQPITLYNCEAGKPFSDDTCVSDNGQKEDDPVLTPLIDSQIRSGDVVKTRVSFLDLGTVGFIFMPGELPPELVVGLPKDFDTATNKYYIDGAGLHAEGSDYDFPGYLLSLVDRDVTFTVGLGEDELGYWVPVNEYRLKCLGLVFRDGQKCADLNARGIIPHPDSIDGATCKKITDDPAALKEYSPTDASAVAAICRYGQALGRELGEPEGHYEETNAAGWDLVTDLWNAATTLFGEKGTGRINPENPGYTIQHPPS